MPSFKHFNQLYKNERWPNALSFDMPHMGIYI